MGKDLIIFCRHRSGPVYLWYEIISPRYLRQHTDSLAVKGVVDEDIVIDSQEEILWRLRALTGLRNALGTRILAVGGPDAWAQPPGVVPGLSKTSGNSTCGRFPMKSWVRLSKRRERTGRP